MTPQRLRTREISGSRATARVQDAAQLLRIRALTLSTHLELSPIHHEEVTTLSLDPVENRYLLSGDCAVQGVMRDRSVRSNQRHRLRPVSAVTIRA